MSITIFIIGIKDYKKIKIKIKSKEFNEISILEKRYTEMQKQRSLVAIFMGSVIFLGTLIKILSLTGIFMGPRFF